MERKTPNERTYFHPPTLSINSCLSPFELQLIFWPFCLLVESYLVGDSGIQRAAEVASEKVVPFGELLHLLLKWCYYKADHCRSPSERESAERQQL